MYVMYDKYLLAYTAVAHTQSHGYKNIFVTKQKWTSSKRRRKKILLYHDRLKR